ncbi:MAG TPA: diaminopimelate dehydrogenase [Firmicutes bacterium]|nr:diaminopimelate dehydrogenase [Bacillota bacterium]
MKKIRVCVVGYGNVGKEAVECIRQANDMELAGVVEIRNIENPGVRFTRRVEELNQVDVAVLTIPSRLIPSVAPTYLAKGINTVDGYDIHGDSMLLLKKKLSKYAKDNGRTAVIGAGWDPGTDSVIRMLFMAIAPHGITYTNFGPGMSMGHSVAAKSIPGVKDAISMTLPTGYGQHYRDVYIELEEGANFDEISGKIKDDPYFVHDVTRVTEVEDVEKVRVTGHGVQVERIGSSGTANNQLLELRMRLTNPSATAQILISAARASMRLEPGCYVMGEIPPVDLLPGDRATLVKNLV